MKTYFPAKRTATLWRIRIAAFGVLLLSACLMVKPIKPYFGWISAAVAALSAVALAYFPKYLKSFKLHICESAVIIECGVVIQHEKIMPQKRLLYTEQRTTPLAERLGVSSLVLRAAKCAVFIPELLDTDVYEILEALKK